MPTNDKEYMKLYMRMMREAKRLRKERIEKYGESDLKPDCLEFREQVIEWYEGKLQKNLKISCSWNQHMCNCHECAIWFVSLKSSTFKTGVNLFPKIEKRVD